MSQKISKEEVEHVAKLARLHLSTEEVEKFTAQLGEVLDYVELLPEASCQKPVASSNYKPPATGHRPLTYLRDDEVKSDGASTHELLSNVPQTEGTNIKVPAVLGGGDE